MNAGFIGIGSMGGMLSRMLLRSQALQPENVWVANRSRSKQDALTSEFPRLNTGTNRELAANCDLIFLCLKPADTAAALAEMDQELHSGQLLVTLASMIPLSLLERRVPCRAAKVIPSVTQEIASGVALLQYGTRTTADDRRLIENLLGHICRPVVMPETLVRIAADLVSCGPAFLAYFLQSMAESAIENNPELSLAMARGLVWDMASATVRLISESGMTPKS